MKKIAFVFLMVFLCLININCGGQESVIPDLTETTDPSSITLRQIDDDFSSRIEIPLASFGETEADLAGGTIDVSLNGEILAQAIAPEEYFVETVQLISFEITHVQEGDVIDFQIVNAGGGVLNYEGTFSQTEDTKAPLVVTEEEVAGEESSGPVIVDI